MTRLLACPQACPIRQIVSSAMVRTIGFLFMNVSTCLGCKSLTYMQPSAELPRLNVNPGLSKRSKTTGTLDGSQEFFVKKSKNSFVLDHFKDCCIPQIVPPRRGLHSPT